MMGTFQSMPMRTRILALSGVGVLLTLVLGATSFWAFGESHDAMTRALIYTQSIRNQMDADMMHDAIRADVLEAMLAKDVKAIKDAESAAGEHIARIEKAMQENQTLPLTAALQTSLRAILPQLSEFTQTARGVLAAREKNPEATPNLEIFDQRFTALEPVMEHFSEQLEAETLRSREAAEVFQTRVRLLVAGLATLAVLMLIAIAAILSRFVGSLLGRLTGSLAGSLDTVTSVSSRLSELSGSLAANLQSQSAAIVQSAESTNQIRDSIAGSASSCSSLRNEVQTLHQFMAQSSSVIEDLNASMRQIEQANHKVGDVMKTIEGIAFQTNILALNASIEAARAGAAGAGFSVVADEVRALSLRSSEAAKDTSGQIELTLSNAQQAAKNLSRVLEVFSRASSATATIAARIEQIDQQAKQQNSSAQDVSAAMNNMRQLTGEASGNASSGSGMADELSTEVEQLREMFTEVTTLVGAS